MGRTALLRILEQLDDRTWADEIGLRIAHRATLGVVSLGETTLAVLEAARGSGGHSRQVVHGQKGHRPRLDVPWDDGRSCTTGGSRSRSPAGGRPRRFENVDHRPRSRRGTAHVPPRGRGRDRCSSPGIPLPAQPGRLSPGTNLDRREDLATSNQQPATSAQQPGLPSFWLEAGSEAVWTLEAASEAS